MRLSLCSLGGCGSWDHTSAAALVPFLFFTSDKKTISFREACHSTSRHYSSVLLSIRVSVHSMQHTTQVGTKIRRVYIEQHGGSGNENGYERNLMFSCQSSSGRKPDARVESQEYTRPTLVDSGRADPLIVEVTVVC